MQPSTALRALNTFVHSWPLAEWIVDRIKIILVEMRRTGLVAGGVRRIKCQIGEKTLARRIAGRDLLELQEVSARVVASSCRRSKDVARTTAAHCSRSAGQLDLARNPAKSSTKARPVRIGPRRRAEELEPQGRIERALHRFHGVSRGRRPRCRGMSCINAGKGRHAILGVFGKPQQGPGHPSHGQNPGTSAHRTSRRECCGG